VRGILPGALLVGLCANESDEECKSCIDRYFTDRNQFPKDNPKRAGDKIWGKERVLPVFNSSNNCKDLLYR
jgi:hypothetical protein